MDNKIINLIKEKYGNYKLCYVESPREMDYESPVKLYFTSLKDVTKQWGDDWDDKPYEHNAGEPYNTSYEKKEPINIITLLIDDSSNIMTPRTNLLNSAYSVEDINNKKIYWLQIVDNSSAEFVEIKKRIYAGESLKNVIEILVKNLPYANIYAKIAHTQS